MDNPTLDAMARRMDRLERENRRWRWAALSALIGLVALGALSGLRPRSVEARQAEKSEKPPGNPSELYTELHRMGHRAIAIIDETVDMGAPVSDPSFKVSTWSLRLLGTDFIASSPKEGPRTLEPEIALALAKGPLGPERIKALREHLARMRLWENRFRPLVRDGRLSALDFMEFQARRIVAEAWLARAMEKE